jgi:hypothetical protein
MASDGSELRCGRVAAQYAPAVVAVELIAQGGARRALVRFALADPLACSAGELTRELRDRLDDRGVELSAKARRQLAETVQHLVDRCEAERCVADKRDLNTVSPAVLAEAKKIMDRNFKAAALAKGDRGFVYDVKKDFKADDSDNSWDEEDA